MLKYIIWFALAGSAYGTTITEILVTECARPGYYILEQASSCPGPNGTRIDAGGALSFPDANTIQANIVQGTGPFATQATRDQNDFYFVQPSSFSGSLFGVFALNCSNQGTGVIIFSIESGNLQPCEAFKNGIRVFALQENLLTPALAVNSDGRTTINSTVIITSGPGIQGFISLAFTGFQDSLGHPVMATLGTPEPSTWIFTASGLLLAAWKRRRIVEISTRR